MSIDNVTDLEPINQYVAAAAQTDFDYTFPIFEDADLVVVVDGTVQALDTDYEVDGAGDDEGGTVTFTTALAGAEIVTIYRDIAIERLTDIAQNGKWASSTYNDEQDKTYLLLQDLKRDINRSLRIPLLAEVISDDIELDPSAFGGFYLTFDADGKPTPAALSSTTITAPILGGLLNPPTAAENAASVVPVDLAQLPGFAIRQKVNTLPGTTDMATAIQNSANAMSTLDPVTYIKDANGLSKPILIKSTFPSSFGISGNGAADSILQPLSADIKQAPENINACIINKNNNPHLHLEKMRFASSAAYTGVAVYCKEGGGGDGLAQCAFSAYLHDIFCDFPSTNSGFSTGAWQNSSFRKMTFENAKGVFTVEGVGSADNFFNGNSLFNCYDHFFGQTADTNGSFLTTIDGLHAYNHNRGRLIDVQNVNGFIADNVILEPNTGNLGSVGLAKIKNSVNVILSNQIAVARTGVPQADIAYEVEGSTLKLHDCIIDAAIGIRISGTSAVYIELDNVTFTNSATACIQINGAASGTIRTRGCKFNNSQVSAILTSVSNSISWYSEGDEFLNAGLAGSAGARNITLTTSGTVRIVNATIGRDNVSAAAGYFVDASGSSTVSFINLHIVGTPPTGFNTGAQAISLDGLGGTWVPAVGGSATYTTQQGWYKIISNVLHFGGRLTINAIGTGSKTTVSGLPFNAGATYYGAGDIPFFASAVATFTRLGLTVAPSANSFVIRTLTAAAASTGTADVFQNGTDIIFGGSVPLG